MDPERIALDDPRSVAHWCARFDCTEPELIHAVWKVGHDPKDVARFLGVPQRSERPSGHD
jgi:hypothetical protein